MASSFASYASWLSVDDTEPPKSVEPPKSAEPPKSVDQVGWVELATQATQTDEDPLDFRWDGSTWLVPGDWETDPVDIIPGKSEVGGVMKLSHPNDSQQPQDEAEPPKPPTKRQRRSEASLGLEGASSQVVDGSQSQPVDGSQSQQIDGSKSQPIVVDGSQSQPVHGLRSEQKTLARQLMLAVLPGLGPAAAEPPKPPTREVVDGSQSQPVDGSQSQPVVDGS